VASSPVVLVDVVATLRPTRRVGNPSVSSSARGARCVCVRTSGSSCITGGGARGLVANVTCRRQQQSGRL